MKVLTGMSGGVDSSVAAALLLEQGYEVIGCTLSLCDNAVSESEAARKVCDRLEIEHKGIDLREAFSDIVIGDFVSEYEKGRTPNPCIVCNKNIKFGKMLSVAEDLGFHKIATGHYAVIKKCGERYLLEKAVDEDKDQSYVLYCLSQAQLSRSLFPLGELTKAQVREKAREMGFINADKADSQDICFVPDGDYAAFITSVTGKEYNEGDYVDTSGNILGRHKGVINYTIGQRKGLGIALGKPQFVISKDALSGRVVLGDEENLFYKRVRVTNVNYIPFDTLKEDMRVKAKLRYRHKEEDALLHPVEDGVIIEFDRPQRAPSAGQSAVFYDGKTVIGGGIIERGLEKCAKE